MVLAGCCIDNRMVVRRRAVGAFVGLLVDVEVDVVFLRVLALCRGFGFGMDWS